MSLGGAIGGPMGAPGAPQRSLTETLRLAWADEELRGRITFVLIIFAVYALCIHVVVPIPGVQPAMLEKLVNDNSFLGLMNQIGGGAFKRLSILALGLGPYISASIILQVLTYANPAWKMELQEGGEYARKQQNRRTRALALILGVFQSVGIFQLIARPLAITPTVQQYVTVAVFWTAGSFLLLWLGEQASEKGIGNGVSLLIFAGIIISMPSLVEQIQRNYGVLVQWWQLVIVAALFLAVTYFVVLFTTAQRRIPVQHMRRNFGTQAKGGGTSYLPISVNMAGVIPVIFAVALIYMPYQFQQMFPAGSSMHDALGNIGAFMAPDFSRWQGYVGAFIYMLLIFGFTFVWNAMIYNVEDIANNLKRAGSYVPGIRPGKQTKDFLNGVITRVTFVGALFLSIAALSQYVFPLFVNIPSIGMIGGTSLLIMVSVALETMRQIEANLITKQYGGG